MRDVLMSQNTWSIVQWKERLICFWQLEAIEKEIANLKQEYSNSHSFTKTAVLEENEPSVSGGIKAKAEW